MSTLVIPVWHRVMISGTWFRTDVLTSTMTALQQMRMAGGKSTKGQVDFTFNGLAQNENGWFAVQGGRVNFECNGLVQNEYGWWYVSGGKVDFTFNGLAANEYGWWKVTKGSGRFWFQRSGSERVWLVVCQRRQN